MVGYRCYILDAHDHIVQAHEIDCPDDAQAESRAADLLAQDPYHRAAEVWEAARRIRKVERAPGSHLRLTRLRQRSERAPAPID